MLGISASTDDMTFTEIIARYWNKLLAHPRKIVYLHWLRSQPVRNIRPVRDEEWRERK